MVMGLGEDSPRVFELKQVALYGALAIVSLCGDLERVELMRFRKVCRMREGS
jgi:hypothetical protein